MCRTHSIIGCFSLFFHLIRCPFNTVNLRWDNGDLVNISFYYYLENLQRSFKDIYEILLYTSTLVLRLKNQFKAYLHVRSRQLNIIQITLFN